MKTVAVIPAYNEGKSVGEVVRGSLQFVDHVVVVDDGSKDNTASVAQAAGAEVVSYSNNKGKAHAMRKGFERCGGYDAVVILDGDLQHSPEEIPRLVSCLEDGNDLCIGSRILAGVEGMPPQRRFSNWFASRLISILTNQTITDPQSGFRAIKQSKLGLMELKAERYAIEHVMILEAARRGFKISEVPITCKYGIAESDIKALRDTVRVMYHITRFLVSR